MDDNSLRSPNSFDLGSFGSNTNNQPPEKPLESGTASSNKQKLDEEDNAVYSMPNKRHQTDPLSPKDQELALLKDMVNFYKQNDYKAAFYDDTSLEMFYHGWIKERGVYKNVVELSNKMYKLYARYQKNKENPLYENEVEVDENYNLPLEDSTDVTGDDTNDLSSTHTTQ
ncbi:hypothetical protein CTI12_AA273930 [Artemisia annua]|uniref:Uncharacterized protein n=1 Tax=Artemisia annua TaxID=35608 RepID=A0A2U1NEC1_ARTAN|nr:hypothetical protein CTI12_AA273930 [Artemisia annua]